jgi:hypothetical protein
LAKDPKERMTIKEALSHPFILAFAENYKLNHEVSADNDKLSTSFEENSN